ncbi:KxYKxGKxW signal peptide domain-containing protein [Streptococcus salivarius]|uniref:KxYKxGKxW signal peptide domain-containing protein n=1 Tax=Streptococcus salivarius TaxID=1304 RepID=UPI001D046F88|nr:KxYKxGKxW signal peptide domain-containing protein [Streptococcus salivarius]MCB5540936.1 KxYKxGKxW signal peptide domain-containing protein [Streptococcus salivarius]
MEKKVHFKLHKVKKHWVTIAVTGLALGLTFASLNYASAEEQPTPVNEATVEAIIKEGAIDVDAPATSEATAKAVENTPATASSEAATVSEAPVAASEVASTETVSEKPSSEVSSTASSEASNSETTHSDVNATTSESVTAENVSSVGDIPNENTTRGTDRSAFTEKRNGFVTEKEERIETENYLGSLITTRHPYYVTYYYDNNGNKLMGWQDINGERYYFKKEREHPGFETIDGKLYYFTDSARMLHDEFVEENGQTYYLGSDGVRVSGLQDIKGQTYYFNPDRNGQLSYGLNVVGDKLYLFGDAGKENAGQLVKDTHLNNGDFQLNIDPNGIVTVANNHPAFLQDNGGHWYYMDKDGKLMTGPQTIDGLTYYFDSNGRQVKGERREVNGKSYFYDPDNGALVTNRLVTFKAGRFIPEENYAKEIRFDFAPYENYYNNEHPELERYYLGADGLPVTGWQTINGNKYFFQDDGNMVVHRFFNNYYFYNDGTIARNKRLNIPTHYIMREFPNIYEFDNDGVGKFISSDFKDLRQKTAYFVQDKDGYWHYYDEIGWPVKGSTTVDGYDMYFHLGTGRQAKGELVDIKGKVYYFDKDNGRKVKDTTFDFDGKTYVADQSGVLSIKSHSTQRNRYISDSEGNWYYVNDKGYLLLGAQTIDNVNVYFGTNGVQYKGHFAPDNHYYDKDNGALVTDRLVEDGGKEFYVDEEGKIYNGVKDLGGIQYYFRDDKKVKGDFDYSNDNLYYYDKETGALVTGKYFQHKNNWYFANGNGKILTGKQIIDGKHVYFYDDDYGQYKGIQAKDKLIILDGKTYYYLPGSGNRADNVTLTINHVTYYFDNDGVGHILR